MRNGAGLPAEHATCCGSFTNERQRRAHAFIHADIKVPTVYALLGHNKVRMRVQRISRLLRTHTAFFTMRICLSYSPSESPFPSLLSSRVLHCSCHSISRSLFRLLPSFRSLSIFSTLLCLPLLAFADILSLFRLPPRFCLFFSLFRSAYRKPSSACFVLVHSRDGTVLGY